jgi:hypothetical protein
MGDLRAREGQADAPAPSRMAARMAAKRARARRRHIGLGTLAVAAAVAGGAVLAWQLVSPGPTAPRPAPSRPSAAPAPSSPSPAPAGLRVAKVSGTRVTLGWRPLAAGTAVTYQVYRDGRAIGTSTKARFSDTTVRPATTYTYAVSALTAAGQPGALSAAIKVTTPRKPRPAPELGSRAQRTPGIRTRPATQGT